MYVCIYGWMDGWIRMDPEGCIRMDASGWMHPDGWMDACMHVCMYVWSRVPFSRERELGGPYHWRGGQGSGVRTHRERER